MKAIGFENFRKFEKFPSIQMGDITIFVGGNNSGKSTTVKAIISVLTFLRNVRFYASGNIKQLNNVNFYFNQNPYVHIGTFARAKCNKSESNDLAFEIQLENYKLKISLNGDSCDDNATYAKVQRILLQDTNTLFDFDINFKDDTVIFTFNKNTHLFENDENYIALVEKINNSYKVDSAKEKLKRLFFDRYPVIDEKVIHTAKLSDLYSKRRMVGGPLISGILFNSSYLFLNSDDSNDDKNLSNRKGILRNYMFKLSNQLDNLLWNRPLVEYIYAHAASQMVLYNSVENNYLSKTIHEFSELREDKDHEAYEFVRKWMNVFSIGKDCKLESIGGEAHTFDIINFDDKRIPLADFGMGTIQLMILFLRIAIIVHGRSSVRYKTPVTVIVEEPEQNLHPQRQSQLLDFFTNVAEDFDVKFIIETHSEYLVRKSQVVVAQRKYESQDVLEKECPYKVYYFPENDTPYKMSYRVDGKFSNKFGSGFFDEASNLSFDLF